jgi:hypothetical protein
MRPQANDAYHANGLNWRPSVATHGSPGASDSAAPFVGTPGADSDGDGLPDLAEYALSTGPDAVRPELLRRPAGLVLRFTRRPGADDVVFTLGTGLAADTFAPLAGAQRLLQTWSSTGDWIEEWLLPPTPEDRRYYRLEVSQP